MIVEKRYANLFPTGEEAHAFDTAVRGAALEAGLSLGSGETADRGRLGVEVFTILSGEEGEIDGFAAEPHEGHVLRPLDPLEARRL